MKRKESLAVNLIIFFWLIFSGIYLYNYLNVNSDKESSTDSMSMMAVSEKLFGFEKDKHIFDSYTLEPNESLGKLLLREGVSWDSILKLDEVSSDIFSIRRFRAKKPFTLVRDSCAAPTCIIYEPNKLTYVKYLIKDTVDVKIVRKNYEVCIEQASGIIESSLWIAMHESGIGYDLIDIMEDAMASSVDFYHTQRGDKFKIIYERKYIDGQAVSNGEILAAAYKDKEGEKFAVFYENEKYAGFYNLKGEPTTGKFLRAPLKHAHISSRYNLRRFHPIKKRRIPHLGTDYAAPRGTPIYSVADGVIEVAGYTKNNGKYVKIKHDDVYKTQYLHMHRFAPGIKKGVRVRQGQVIGQVGSTGLATGPHVCFRFWKYGKQINHLRENFPPEDPLPKDQLPDFFQQRDELLSQLKEIPYPGEMAREDNDMLAMNEE